jgi:hypothetical protein
MDTRAETGFYRFIDERMANYKNPWNTLRSYLDVLNPLVQKVKKPFSEMGYDDLVCVLKDWQQNHLEATAHGRKCKLKAFFRWESGDKDDLRVKNITSGSYVSPVTLDDLLTEFPLLALPLLMISRCFRQSRQIERTYTTSARRCHHSRHSTRFRYKFIRQIFFSDKDRHIHATIAAIVIINVKSHKCPRIPR